MIHHLSPSLLSNAVYINLVGCGGNGSLMLSGLARLDRALRGLGHKGLNVTTYDPDTVSETNVGRQMFYPSDIGHNKAVILTNRINHCFGLSWKATPARYTPDFDDIPGQAELLITCVDSAKTRAEIGAAWTASQIGKQWADHYWLDLGNRAADGQVILGFNSAHHKQVALPCVTDLYPEITAGTVKDDDAPSCSLAEALARQQLFINQAVTTEALELLWNMFRFGQIDHHGLFINLNPRSVRRLDIDPEAWARFGYQPRPTKPSKPTKRKGRKA